MTSPLKDEFKRLFTASGWSQAETARKLHMTRGGVNGIVTGGTIPSPATLDLFRRVLVSEKPEALQGRDLAPQKSTLPSDIEARLAGLNEQDRAAVLKVIQSTLDLVERKPSPSIVDRTKSPHASSKGVEITEEDLSQIEAAVREAQESEPAPKAVSTTGKRAGPSADISRRPSGRPSVPKKAPNES